ncbi:MAG: hypothetical protein LBI18_09065 [Planctomycetaceae bacterium]|jgi:hypothetical protein|nr:hypothetical protein [Planctomycetaceae bacterium]
MLRNLFCILLLWCFVPLLGAAEKQVDIFPSPEFDMGKVECSGLKVSMLDGSLIFEQEVKGDFPKAVIKGQWDLTGCSELVIEGENIGKNLLKIRFGFGSDLPTDHNRLMNLPFLELKEGQKDSLSISLVELTEQSKMKLPSNVTYFASGPPVGHIPISTNRETETMKKNGTRINETQLTVFVFQTGQSRRFKITKIIAIHENKKASVTVDVSKIMRPRREIERYVNNSILQRSPPLELADRIVKEYGRPKIFRCWLCLDDMYHFDTKQFDFNYPIKNHVKGIGVDYEMPDIPYEEYLKTYAAHADEILLNIRRFERHVVEGKLSMNEWKTICKAAILHYKKLCPNLRYIEALNEFHLKAFGNLKTNEYYEFYETFYEIVNEVNDELNPKLPLLVGGPATTGLPPDSHLREFVKLYSEDTNSKKKLDFLSFHHYTNKNLNDASEYEQKLIELLEFYHLPTNIPFFWDELGFTGTPWRLGDRSAQCNNIQASCVTALQYFARKSNQMIAFPWVTFHSPSQTALIQFLYDSSGQLKMTPFGMTVKCWSMQKKNELATKSDGLKPNGSGLGAIGTGDETGITVLHWNHQPHHCEVNLNLDGFSETMKQKKWHVKRYLIDSEYSNCFEKSTEPTTLEIVDEHKGNLETICRFLFVLEPYAVSLIVLEPIF